jgi:hypothetical protein
MEQGEVMQIAAVEDGCLYVYSFSSGSWAKVCRVASFDDLPPSVKNKLQAAGQKYDRQGSKE